MCFGLAQTANHFEKCSAILVILHEKRPRPAVIFNSGTLQHVCVHISNFFSHFRQNLDVDEVTIDPQAKWTPAEKIKGNKEEDGKPTTPPNVEGSKFSTLTGD